MTRPGATVLVLAKSPVAGRSKTRLQGRWTAQQAAAIAEASLADTLETVSLLGVPYEVVLDGSPGSWLPGGCAVRAQVHGSHAERICAAFAGSRGPSLLIGMDTPQVTVPLLRHALRALTEHQACLGLAADGGWWALGLSDPTRHAELVLGVPTSTSRTGALQDQALRAAGVPPLLLPVLRDVDVPEDAEAVAALAPHGRFGTLVRALREAAA